MSNLTHSYVGTDSVVIASLKGVDRGRIIERIARDQVRRFTGLQHDLTNGRGWFWFYDVNDAGEKLPIYCTPDGKVL
jgi:hypothetical protein